MTNLDKALSSNWLRRMWCDTEDCEGEIKFFDPDTRDTFYCEDCAAEVAAEMVESASWEL